MRRTSVPAIGLRVLQRWAATRPKGSVAIAVSRGPDTAVEQPGLSVQESRLWLDAPSRWRYEVDTPGGGTAVSVVDPPLWWSYSPNVHAISNESDPLRYPAPTEHPESPYFRARELMRGLEVASRRSERRGDREIEVIDAIPVGDLAPGLMPGADGYTITIDRDRDVALRCAARADGIEYLVFEVIDIDFDVPLPAELYRIAPPPGVSFGPPPTFGPRSRLGRLLEWIPIRWRGP